MHIDWPNVVVLACKQAEDGNGFIVRLLELEGEETPATLSLAGMEFLEAYRTNIVEQTRAKLEKAAADGYAVFFIACMYDTALTFG